VIDNLCNKFEEDPSNHVLFAIENRKLEFIAIGHIALEQGMELAFSVLKKHQGRGFGNLLMKRCIQYCRTHNILNGNMVCMSSNSVIRHLCKKYGISIKNEQGESLANVELSPADMNTYISETIDNNISALDYITKRVIV
jgi:GNAT superfamily N-acetyltransferase